MTRVDTADHVYFISVGDGDLAGYERSCKVCTVTLRAEPTQYAMAPTLRPILELI